MNTLRKILAALHIGGGALYIIMGLFSFSALQYVWDRLSSNPDMAWQMWLVPPALMLVGAGFLWVGKMMWEERRQGFIIAAVLQSLAAIGNSFFQPLPEAVILSWGFALFFWYVVPSAQRDYIMEETGAALASVARACIGR